MRANEFYTFYALSKKLEICNIGELKILAGLDNHCCFMFGLHLAGSWR